VEDHSVWYGCGRTFKFRARQRHVNKQGGDSGTYISLQHSSLTPRHARPLTARHSSRCAHPAPSLTAPHRSRHTPPHAPPHFPPHRAAASTAEEARHEQHPAAPRLSWAACCPAAWYMRCAFRLATPLLYVGVAWQATIKNSTCARWHTALYRALLPKRTMVVHGAMAGSTRCVLIFAGRRWAKRRPPRTRWHQQDSVPRARWHLAGTTPPTAWVARAVLHGGPVWPWRAGAGAGIYRLNATCACHPPPHCRAAAAALPARAPHLLDGRKNGGRSLNGRAWASG